MPLQAFHGQEAIKKKYVMRVYAHMSAGNLVHGTGWKDGKGSAVGCTLEANEPSRYPIELGIPEWLAHLEDMLFENMGEMQSSTWPLDFLSVIKPGADLERVKGPFLLLMLDSAVKNFRHENFPQVTAAIEATMTLWERSDAGSPEFLEAMVKAAYLGLQAAKAADAEATPPAREAAWTAGWASWSAWSAMLAAKAANSAEGAAMAVEAAERAWTLGEDVEVIKAAGKVVWQNTLTKKEKFYYFASELLRLLIDAPMVGEVR